MNHPELVAKLTLVQNALWPTVSNAVSETLGSMVQINSPLVLETQVEEAVQEFAAPAVVVQFAFAGQRDAQQVLILPLDTAAALGGDEIEVIDAAALETLRAPLEAIVQGLCLGLGNARNEVVVASDLSMRTGRFARPSYLQSTDSMIRVQAAVGVGSSIGSLTWLLDAPTAHFVAGLQQPVATQQQAAFGAAPPFGGSRRGGGDARP